MKLTSNAHLFALATFLSADPALALFDCNNDEHVYPPSSGKFVVHYTPERDSAFPDTPDSWIRICMPNDSGTFDNIDPLATGCGTGHPATFSPAQTTLQQPLTITNGNGCAAFQDVVNTNLDGGAMDFNGQHRDLGGSSPLCGPTGRGITCEFDLDPDQQETGNCNLKVTSSHVTSSSCPGEGGCIPLNSFPAGAQLTFVNDGSTLYNNPALNSEDVEVNGFTIPAAPTSLVALPVQVAGMGVIDEVSNPVCSMTYNGVTTSGTGSVSQEPGIQSEITHQCEFVFQCASTA